MWITRSVHNDSKVLSRSKYPAELKIVKIKKQKTSLVCGMLPGDEKFTDVPMYEHLWHGSLPFYKSYSREFTRKIISRHDLLARTQWRRESAPITFQKEKKQTKKTPVNKTTSVLCSIDTLTMSVRKCIHEKKKAPWCYMTHQIGFFNWFQQSRAHHLKITSDWCHASIITLQNIYKTNVRIKCILTRYKS